MNPAQRRQKPERRDGALDLNAVRAQHSRFPEPARGRQFSENLVPPGFYTIIDPTTHPVQPWRDLPPATGLPPFHVALDSVLSPDAMNRIQETGTLIFHAVGDTGGVNTATFIENVATYMERDFLPDAPQDSPSFFFHLGDVVYYDGEGPNYYAEFYEPYIRYPAPIFAIPGNHDGDVNPATKESSLEAFVRNFCSQTPVFSPDNHDAPRHTMTQPNVYWTLETPLATIIGLYSNCPEGGQLSPAQIQWFETELRTAPADRALIVAVHHPIYSAYGPHPGSQHLKGMLDQACSAAGRSPNLVLTGHVHNYQRFAAPLPGARGVPFIVAGAGGYNKRLHGLSRAFHGAKLPIQIQGAAETLEQFNDAQHGYLKITVTAQKVVCQYYTVPEPSAPTDKLLQPFDSVEVPLRK